MTYQKKTRAIPSSSPDEVENTAATPVLGDRIRGLRKRRQMTLMQLADSTNLSAGYISQLERNLASPSIAALVNVAKALGVTVQWFFSGNTPVPAAEEGFVVRRGNRLQMRYEQGVVDELLTARMDMQLEMLHVRIPPGAESPKSYSHEGDEVAYVQTGQLEIWIGDDRHFLLSEGDSVAFSSQLAHRYRNPGVVETVIIWAISPPSY
ncbi:helix-turn-helix domain-containing protein [Paraburkholderia mimosarum]|uniref:helix-turn-helix domain-containing protein n=1 Tax=Paraburkholderia mimosarum TaxID=312026 RepID=UPI0004144379|nr:XRE family transcriptional regulator [Paraburkholderia mimosarum]